MTKIEEIQSRLHSEFRRLKKKGSGYYLERCGIHTALDIVSDCAKKQNDEKVLTDEQTKRNGHIKENCRALSIMTGIPYADIYRRICALNGIRL